MSTPQATGMGFNDFQTYLATCNTDISAGNWSGAFTALAQAKIVLAGTPDRILTGHQLTRFRLLKDLDGLESAITAAQVASTTNGAGMGIGLFSITRAR